MDSLSTLWLQANLLLGHEDSRVAGISSQFAHRASGARRWNLGKLGMGWRRALIPAIPATNTNLNK